MGKGGVGILEVRDNMSMMMMTMMMMMMMMSMMMMKTILGGEVNLATEKFSISVLTQSSKHHPFCCLVIKNCVIHLVCDRVRAAIICLINL